MGARGARECVGWLVDNLVDIGVVGITRIGLDSCNCGCNDWGIKEREESDMSVVDMMGMLGREYLLTVDAFTIVVTVEDIKVSYGTERALVQPVGGQGSAWVAASRLREYVSA